MCLVNSIEVLPILDFHSNYSHVQAHIWSLLGLFESHSIVALDIELKISAQLHKSVSCPQSTTSPAKWAAEAAK